MAAMRSGRCETLVGSSTITAVQMHNLSHRRPKYPKQNSLGIAADGPFDIAKGPGRGIVLCPETQQRIVLACARMPSWFAGPRHFHSGTFRRMRGSRFRVCTMEPTPCAVVWLVQPHQPGSPRVLRATLLKTRHCLMWLSRF